MMIYTIRDPFAGELEVEGETLEEAIAEAYDDIDPRERPAYVWHAGDQIAVPQGHCRPVF